MKPSQNLSYLSWSLNKFLKVTANYLTFDCYLDKLKPKLLSINASSFLCIGEVQDIQLDHLESTWKGRLLYFSTSLKFCYPFYNHKRMKKLNGFDIKIQTAENSNVFDKYGLQNCHEGKQIHIVLFTSWIPLVKL